ncbi:uncharacterized protein LOC131069232 isoform X2 [Cryptomeria japonica]|nr:uncharacterized protein LOC131069232 isoform X2 [Cryptomeria japonica]XP_057860578.1 uncharacterized protein LOC131069232 isoform X2 [Cryptomeria japonica]
MLEYVPNRGEVLSVMERHKIGLKHALYYKAYALHYEKLKKFPDAEAMYKLGIQRLAEPAESLQQSYDSFLHRMVHRNKKLKSRKSRVMLPFEEVQSKGYQCNMLKSHEELGIKGGEIESENYPEGGTILTYSDKCTVDGETSDKYVHRNENLFNRSKLPSVEDKEQNKGKVNSEGESSIALLGTVVVSAPSLVSNSSYQDTIGLEESLHCEHAEEVHDTYHSPFNSIVNTKEVKLSINHVDESIRMNPSQAINGTKLAVENFKILPSKNLEDRALNEQHSTKGNNSSVLADHMEHDLAPAEENESGIQEDNRLEELVPVKCFEMLTDGTFISSQEQTSKDERTSSLLFKDCKDLSGISSREQNNDSGGLEEIQSHKHLGESSGSLISTEDTVIIRKFVDSTIVGDTQQVEDAYHHGLIEPTINTKEAIAEINNMFGKPLKFEKPKSVNQPWKMQTAKQPMNSFQVLVDEDLKASEGETPINPLEKDLQVFIDENVCHNSLQEFIDENVCHNSSDESLSSKNFSSFQESPVLADISIKGSQDTVNDKGYSSAPVEFYEDGMAIIEKSVNNSKEKNSYRQFGTIGEMTDNSKFCSEDTIVIRKFVDSAIVGDSKELESAFHHGLVDPTVNTKEAMEDINMMFLKPLQFDKPKSKKQSPSARTFKQPDENFRIFSDEVFKEQGMKQGCFVNSFGKTHDSSLQCIKDLEIFVDENLMCGPLKEHTGMLNSSEDGHISIHESSERMQKKTLNKCSTFENRGPSFPPLEVYQDIQFPPAVSLPLKSCNEDTIVIRKIVDSTLADTEIEDACHHGLVEPTINTKEAMADINNMFCQTLPFDYSKRSCLPLKAGTIEEPCKGPWILTDEDMEKEDLDQRVLLPNNTKEYNCSVRTAKDFKITVDENGDCKYTNKRMMKSCLLGDNVSVPILNNNDNSLDIQKKSFMLFENSKDEDVCKPTGCFEVFIDEQFQE